MRRFYFFKKSQQVADHLTWSHCIELLPLKDKNELNYYLKLSITNHLSRNGLRKRIKSKEYERLSEEVKSKLVNNENLDLIDNIPEPIIIKSDKDIISEKVLQRVILEDISSFMKALGSSFSFIDNEYKIKIGNQYNYIDLLLFNIEYNCYVVIELKVTKLKKEHIGQIEIYMNYIDKYIKKINHDKTIGIIIVRRNNKYIIEYCSDKRIISREYKII